MKIGPQTLNTARDLIDSLFRMHQHELDVAYLKSDNALSVSLNVKFKPSEDGGIDVDAGISFVTDRVKDSVMRNVQEGQEDLFSGEKITNEGQEG